MTGNLLWPEYSAPTDIAAIEAVHGHVLDGLDPDGFVHLAGRAKDLIIRGGHNIDPALVEDALLAHPAVTAAGAVGRPDVHSGEVPVTVLDALPLTDLGKPYKVALRADATRRELIEALAGVPGVLDVEAEIDEGSVIAAVRTSDDADEPASKAVLGRYAIGWRLAGAS
ncbi:hypothetical protein [Lentzea flava]|uniref:AMP-binding enzyme C-terminal domain-containing protein n=1 Tax=Lentzea flava TaxID=103732 RepID=A0ABQ2UQW2_9PSEU|nr:hypothetical protein [Lentzea flava]MCP2201131.1 AMP-binding enzyme C-terminal domain-containing protein [Lentzea flava]GGU48296.1 hypothetical protein GCM10010178_46290 [Lentzea flava]